MVGELKKDYENCNPLDQCTYNIETNKMKNIGEISLTKKQTGFINSIINRYGNGQHPVSDINTFDYFTIDYVKELTEKPKVVNNLTPIGLEILNEIKELLVDV